MARLNNAEIQAACEQVVDTAETYQYLQFVAFKTMLQTGCREGEAVDLWRWTLSPYGYYILSPQKGNSRRQIEATDIPEPFRMWIADRPTGKAPTSTDRLRSAFVQMCPYGKLTSGSKGISTHLFRYNHIRRLAAAGKTIAEIKVIMGLSSTKVINGYLDNDVNS